MEFGLYGEFPIEFGGTDGDPLVVEHQALLDALEPALDPTENTVHEVETYTEARTLSMIWDAGDRAANQAQPSKMLEALPDWEVAMKLVPEAGSTDNARRDTVAAKFRGLAGNALADIEDALRKLLGPNFEEIVTVAREDVIAYWPGGVPGPPGYEWTSTVAHIGIRVNLKGLGATSGQRFGAKLFALLDSLVPVWMTYTVGVGDEWVVGEGVVGLTFL